ncbi:hypothetical protein [Microbacterium sp. P04]|uniref:hypothetical protein n=1 Tax=Microbacterium sp. P04 TaxID=3366947 RepID=UPI00374762DB
MASYDEFSTLVGQIKRSAIDLFMKDEGYDLLGGEYVNGNRGSDLKVSRPGADGEGGGDWSVDDFLIEWLQNESKDAYFQESFANIRASVDAIVEPWTDLPDPADVEPIVETCRQVTRRLAAGGSTSDGAASGGGPLAGTLALIEQNLNAMSGQAIAAFKDKFLAQLGLAVSGYHAISIARGVNVASQQGLWQAARDDVAAILQTATQKIDAAVDAGSVDWNQVLTVVGWAAKGLSIFASGGATLPLQVAGLGIEILKDPPTGGNEVDKSFGDYAGAMDTLQGMLQGLSDRIAAEEQAIIDNITKNLANIRADTSSYDLSPPSVSGQDEVIAINPPLIEEITGTYMPSVKSELDSIASLALGCTTSAAVSRDPFIGVGVYGPSYTLYDLTVMLYELIKNLSWEVELGAQILHLVVGDFELAEQQRLDELDRLNEAIAAGSTYDPWD